jgi:hypothetical protein
MVAGAAQVMASSRCARSSPRGEAGRDAGPSSPGSPGFQIEEKQMTRVKVITSMPLELAFGVIECVKEKDRAI